MYLLGCWYFSEILKTLSTVKSSRHAIISEMESEIFFRNGEVGCKVSFTIHLTDIADLLVILCLFEILQT